MSPEHGIWRQWTPANAANVAFSDVVEAVSKFQSVEGEAGDEATEWLRHRALDTHPATITYLYLTDDEIGGYFALASTSVSLTWSDDEESGWSERNYMTQATQGASLIPWLAKHRDVGVRGSSVLQYAVSVALRVASMQGTPVLILDAYDNHTGALWKERYGFRSGPPTYTGKLRLWMPMDPK